MDLRTVDLCHVHFAAGCCIALYRALDLDCLDPLLVSGCLCVSFFVPAFVLSFVFRLNRLD